MQADSTTAQRLNMPSVWKILIRPIHQVKYRKQKLNSSTYFNIPSMLVLSWMIVPPLISDAVDELCTWRWKLHLARNNARANASVTNPTLRR